MFIATKRTHHQETAMFKMVGKICNVYSIPTSHTHQYNGGLRLEQVAAQFLCPPLNQMQQNTPSLQIIVFVCSDLYGGTSRTDSKCSSVSHIKECRQEKQAGERHKADCQSTDAWGIELFAAFPYSTISVCGIRSDDPSFIFDIGNLCLSSFLCQRGQRLINLSIFSKNLSCFDFYLLFFYFQFQ